MANATGWKCCQVTMCVRQPLSPDKEDIEPPYSRIEEHPRNLRQEESAGALYYNTTQFADQPLAVSYRRFSPPNTPQASSVNSQVQQPIQHTSRAVQVGYVGSLWSK